MELSKRMQAIADMVTPGNTVADVGCDHGFVSIYLYEKKIAPKVIAMDVRSGPLKRAYEHIKEHGLNAYIETRLSDGITNLQAGEADTLVIAGMGGKLMVHILDAEIEKTKLMKELILQPQSDLTFFREYLSQRKLQILDENMVKEDGKFYVIIKASYCNSQKEKTDAAKENQIPEEFMKWKDCYGPILLANKHPLLKEYLEVSLQEKKSVIAKLKDNQNSEKGMTRLQEIIREYQNIERGLKFFYDSE